MGTTALRQFLKSLCNNSHWKYAVLWKIRHGNPMILNWEDGYCGDYQKPGEPMESMSGGINCSGADEIFSSHCEMSICSGGLGGYPIGLVVADMSRLQYTLGEGVVGKVAHTGNHSWVIFDKIFTGEVNCQLVPECPEEWLLQLAVGIKTILLVPVLPHGVLQLGSWEVVAEDLAVVSYVKDRFTLHDVRGDTVPFSLKRDIQAQLSPSLISMLMVNFDEPSAITFSPSISDESIAVDYVKPNKNKLSTINEVVPLLTLQDTLHVPGKDLPEILKGASENKIGVPPVGLVEVSTLLGQSIDDSQLEMVESKLLGLSCLEEELLAYIQCSKYDEGVFEESSNGILNFYSAGDMMGQPFGDKYANDTDHKSVSSFLRFPKHCELHKALGPTFQGQANENLWDPSFPVEDTCSSLSLICNRDHINDIDPSWFVKGEDAECLLEAVVTNANSGSDDTSSNRSHSVKSSTISSVKFAASSQPQSQTEASALVGDGDSVPWRINTSALVAKGGNAFTTSGSFKSMISTLIDKEQQEKGCNYMQPKKGVKLSNVSKRRARPGENQRPRPRDRQLIQDRVKELRELVPNGTKCSIDGLLDRTIKHMLYLRSITDQAEKLKQWVHQEVAVDKNLISSETKDGCHNGTSWAFELGSELQVCPIVVEDLPSPGHMLIEMLCNEHGFFLEIAQEIRRLDLTILKGVIESRSNNTWAHFIVEATKGFHRMDIFWPMMHLLQRKRNSISSRI